MEEYQNSEGYKEIYNWEIISSQTYFLFGLWNEFIYWNIFFSLLRTALSNFVFVCMTHLPEKP